MYNYLFYFFYSYYDRTEKWKEAKVPFISAVLVMSVLFMFNYLFIRDFIIYHLNGFKYKTFQYEYLIIPTILIGLNYWYFKKNDRFKKILIDYEDVKNNKSSRFYYAWAYIILSVVLVIMMGYSVRNNIKWI